MNARKISIISFSLGAAFLLGILVWKFVPWSWVVPGKVTTEPAVLMITRVIDGDTVVLSDGRTVRYLGINAPEKGEEGFLEAKERNEELVSGKEVRLEYDLEKKDRYGRDLAYVFVGEEMINLKLLAEDLAQVFIIGPNLKYAEEFIRAATR